MRKSDSETNRSLGERIDKTNERIDETNENINVRFKWLMTTMVALTGVIIAVINSVLDETRNGFGSLRSKSG